MIAVSAQQHYEGQMPTNVFDTMMVTFRGLLEQAYEHGAKDALKRIVDVAQSHDATKAEAKRGRPNGVKARAATGIKRRAPRGAPRALVERVIKSKGAVGASASEIASAAESTVEKSVSTSAIRLELNRGKKERRYKVAKGKWRSTGKA
jgi:hypothetical protein